MKKLVAATAITLVATTAVVNQDMIRETYYQQTVNPSIEVNSGVTSFCGVDGASTETPGQLIEQVRTTFDSSAFIKRVIEAKDVLIGTSDKYEELSNQLDQFGYDTDEQLQKNYDYYSKYSSKSSAYAKFAKEAKQQIEFRKANPDLTRDSIRQQRAYEYEALAMAAQDKVDSMVEKEVSALACKFDLDIAEQQAIKNQLAVTYFDKLDEGTQQMMNDYSAKKRQSNKTIANVAFPKAADAIVAFVGDSILNIKPIGSTTEIEDKDGFTPIKTHMDISLTNAFGRKRLGEVTISGYINGYNPVLGSAIVSNINIKVEDIDRTVFLKHAERLTAESIINNQMAMTELKQALVKEFK
ncbi:hypothetical protein J4N45_14400 [Vibrio sp. SCSIO 43140]|uniref:hypothetical protein n=1 Tax=Vibrio sp. SCSIO 43140 TaxID=2819100 RepID=UPI002075F616|nr:hypothetical protein [Vibrio sp. SCSIO 43140]USD58820.1 hypothetical protein J4N45_09785 [Vibrio sp. SCSIO 43140]USD59154.1 hypothetical protein J4N45_11490 [Vibrio sp. SCSIO 43140]USD59693.1 hypothetical protein J4N45_14400 [Vibrio sp. SCSIO 43140]